MIRPAKSASNGCCRSNSCDDRARGLLPGARAIKSRTEHPILDWSDTKPAPAATPAILTNAPVADATGLGDIERGAARVTVDEKRMIIRGPAKLLDDVCGGFLNTYVASRADREALLVDMGGTWRLERVSIKPYASCRGTQSGVDSVGIIMDRNAISAGSIKEILRCSSFLHEMCGGRDLSTLASSQMSLPLAVALRAVFGDANLTVYQKENRHSAAVAGMLARVKMVPDSSLPHS